MNVKKSIQSKSDIDFDEEGRKIFARLNLDPSSGMTKNMWNPLDPIWRHPSTGGTIYVGNQSAASDINLLKTHNITHIVNCTHGKSKIPNFHPDKLKYFEFQISTWSTKVNSTNASVMAFARPLFDFVNEALENGSSVLVHCLAGAHRAGTTGCACLIYYADLDPSTAISVAKRCRPVIDPIGHLPEFLQRLHRAVKAKSTSH